MLGLGTCHNISAERLLAGLADASARLIITDPPWGTTDLSLDKDGRPAESIWGECKRVLHPDGWLLSFGTLALLAEIAGAGFVNPWNYVWVKDKPNLNRQPDRRPALGHELIGVFHLPDSHNRYFDQKALRTYGHANYTVKAAKRRRVTAYRGESNLNQESPAITVQDGSRAPQTVLHHPSKSGMKRAERTDHPTQKPLSLLAYLIGGLCPPDGLVVDPFAGSGTALVAARAVGGRRRFVGSDTDERWCRLAVGRLDETIG